MLRTSMNVAVVCAALSVPAVSYAQAGCTRADLQSAVNSYLAAQGQGSVSKLPLATSKERSATYTR